MNQETDWYSPREVAALVGVSRVTIVSWFKKKQWLEGVYCGPSGRWRIYHHGLIKLLRHLGIVDEDQEFDIVRVPPDEYKRPEHWQS